MISQGRLSYEPEDWIISAINLFILKTLGMLSHTLVARINIAPQISPFLKML